MYYDKCPECGGRNVWQYSADVGVGIIYGPACCGDCDWDSDVECGPLIDESDVPGIDEILESIDMSKVIVR